MKTLKNRIDELIEKSLQDKQCEDEIVFHLSVKSISKIYQLTGMDLSRYDCVIRSHEVRHIKKGHPDDLWVIKEIPTILEDFKIVRKSIIPDRKTNQPLVNLEFYKTINSKEVKLVKLRIHKKKRLELKTAFVMQ